MSKKKALRVDPIPGKGRSGPAISARRPEMNGHLLPFPRMGHAKPSFLDVERMRKIIA